jgi:HK97 family phage major capsid protein
VNDLRTAQEYRDRQDEIAQEIAAIDAQFRGKPFDEETREHFASLVDERKENEHRITELDMRQRYLEHIATNPANRVEGFAAPEQEHGLALAARDQALRTIERHQDVAQADALERDERLVRGDSTGGAGRYIASVGNEHYSTAFAKMVADPTTGHLRFSPQEVEAVRRVTQAQMEQRALATTSTGIPVPFALDPSLVISGSGAINPLRQIARVELSSEGTWKTASTAEVSASYDPEASETSDDTPAMLQPTVTTQRGTAFIPFSLEVDQDWNTASQELAQLLADGRDVLDATKFVLGSGTNEPVGFLTIGTTGALTTTQRVQTAGAGAIAIGDIYALKQALPARFMANASWLMHPTRVDGVFRLVGSGSTTEPQIMPQGRGGPLLGKPVYEISSMTTAVATGSKWAVYGDFTKFAIIDRLGFSVELIPHLFGATNRFPTGSRGLYGFWRTGTSVLAANGLRYGETL